MRPADGDGRAGPGQLAAAFLAGYVKGVVRGDDATSRLPPVTTGKASRSWVAIRSA